VKVGAEDKKKLIIAVVLGVVALLLVGEFLFNSGGSSASSPTAAAPVAESASPGAKAKGHGKKLIAAAKSLDPELRYDWLKASEDTKYQGNGRNIFEAQEVVIEKPVAPAVKPKPQVVDNTPPPPPPPPPINLKFFGFANRPGEAKKVFLEQGEDIFVASEGDIVNRRYKVLHIAPTMVEVEDVLNNNRQSIPLTQG
jgi:hypothetical protein